MTDKILYLPTEGTTGFWGLRAIPDEPECDPVKWDERSKIDAPCCRDYVDCPCNQYKQALESCKSNKLEIVNPEILSLLGIETKGLLAINPGDVVNLPIGYQFKEEERFIPKPYKKLFSQTPVEAKIESVKVLRLVKTETKEVFQPGDRIDLCTGYACDRGKFLRYEDGLVVWESDLGGVYRSSTDTYKIKVLSRANPELFSQPEPEESQTEFSNFLFKNLDDYKFMKEGWKEGTHQYETYDLMVREYRKIIDKFLETTIQRKKQ